MNIYKIKMTERIVLSGQNCSAIFINETGLYNLVLSSRLPIANRFKRLVSVKGCPKWSPLQNIVK
ncbi:BRO family protein [Ruminococcus flavefaciens]|uniref:BRO family protein n=1 Tax=Ruminococcus flavefaciens TaxID=1265 RepID=UPI00093044FC